VSEKRESKFIIQTVSYLLKWEHTLCNLIVLVFNAWNTLMSVIVDH